MLGSCCERISYGYHDQVINQRKNSTFDHTASNAGLQHKNASKVRKVVIYSYIFIHIYIILHSGSRTQEHPRQPSVIYEPSLMFASNIFPLGDFCIKHAASCHHLFCIFSFAKNSSSVSWEGGRSLGVALAVFVSYTLYFIHTFPQPCISYFPQPGDFFFCQLWAAARGARQTKMTLDPFHPANTNSAKYMYVVSWWGYLEPCGRVSPWSILIRLFNVHLQ